MTVLILDLNNESLIQLLRQNKYLKIITGTICRPKLYPLPDVIILDFDQVFGHSDREDTLIMLASKLHPQVMIIACSRKWSDGTRKFARLFGADECIESNKIVEIVDRIKLFFS
ncbi:MAG: hypothetical protein IJH07_07175 [Ruminococcus sp.]|nr:hypothetical protein [Ruminococcus sp.]